VGAGLLIVCPLLRWRAAVAGDYDVMRHLTPTHLRIDSLMVGVILARAWAFRRAWLSKLAEAHRWTLRTAGLLLLAPTMVCSLEQDRWMHVTGFSLFAVGGAFLLVSALAPSTGGSNPATRAVAVIGFYSYSIYLWHLPFARVLDTVFAGQLGPNAWLAVYLVGTLFLGIVMGKMVEWPALRLRDRWFPRRTGRN
jgi:peptidoglycan/LPS O-acetylase OafA/YrhL